MSGQLEDFARRYTAAWCSQDAARVAAFFSPTGSLAINRGEPAVGQAAIAASAREFMTAFPDLRVVMDGLIDQGSRAIYQWTLTGTNTGPGGTGRQVRISGFENWRIGPDDLVAESLGYFDSVAYQRQLGHEAPGLLGLAGDQANQAGIAIAAVNAALDRALVSGTPEEASRHFTVDAVLGESGVADVVGRAAITAFLAKGNEVRTVTWHQIHRDDLIHLGDRAIEFARFDETKRLAGGAIVEERGRFVTDWRYDADGSWRIGRLVISDLPR